MRLVRSLVVIMPDVLEVHFLGSQKQRVDTLVEMALVFLDRQHVVSVPRDNRLDNPGLAAQGIDGHHTARHFQHLQKLGERGDLVRFVVHLDLP